MKSPKHTLNFREISKGIFLAFFGGCVTFFAQNPFTEFSSINWQSIFLAGVTPLAGYLGKTFFEDNK